MSHSLHQMGTGGNLLECELGLSSFHVRYPQCLCYCLLETSYTSLFERLARRTKMHAGICVAWPCFITPDPAH